MRKNYVNNLYVLVLQLMGYGCGVRGHHVQHHVEQELGLELQILALLRYMLECHVLEMEQKLKVVEVSDINIFI